MMAPMMPHNPYDGSERMIKLIRENLNLIKENTQIVMKLDARIRRMEHLMGVPSDEPLMMRMIAEKDMAPEYKEPKVEQISHQNHKPKSVMDLTGNRE